MDTVNGNEKIEFKTKEGESTPAFVREEEQSDKDVVKETCEFSFGGQQFHASYWRPAKDEVKEAKTVVFMTHGYGEYLSFAYEELASQLVRQCNVLVFGHDHIGHGRSSGTRVHVNTMEDFTAPVIAHIDYVRTHLCPGAKVFIHGHSMGGLISLTICLKNPDLCSGLFLNGPLVALDPDLATPIKRFLAKMLQGVVPYFALGALEAELVTRDAKIVQRIKDDPLMWHGGFRARFSWVLMEGTDCVQNNLPNLSLPLLVVQGEKDKLVCIEGSKMLDSHVSSKDKEYVVYPDALHNLVIETEDVKSDVLSRFTAFVNRLMTV